MMQKTAVSESANKYFNYFLVAYLFAVVICFPVFRIAPLLQLMVNTPLYSVQTYLGILGGGLIFADLFLNRDIFRGSYCWVLYLLCGIVCVSSLLTINYGIKDNIFCICWYVIQISLFYSLAYRFDKDTLLKILSYLFWVLLVFWGIACMISCAQFVFHIGYYIEVNPMNNSGLVYQGFLENRLFGIFSSLNPAVFFSLILFIASIYFFSYFKKIWAKILLVFWDIFLFGHIILSGSRSAEIALFFFVFFFALALFCNKIAEVGLKKLCIAFIMACFVVILFVPCYMGTKNVLAEIPSSVMDLSESRYNASLNNIKEQSSVDENDDLGSQILNRTDTGMENISNNRFSIWKDYLSLSSDIGLFGFSPKNYMPYIKDNYPDLYIVEHIKEYYPHMFEDNKIYHVHNGFLLVYVSGGICGALLLALYYILCFRDIFLYIKRKPVLSLSFLIPLACVGVCLVDAMFGTEIFFCYSEVTFLFWIVMGIVMKIVTEKDTDAEADLSAV